MSPIKKRNKHCKTRRKRIGRIRKEENRRGFKKSGAWISKAEFHPLSIPDIDSPPAHVLPSNRAINDFLTTADTNNPHSDDDLPPADISADAGASSLNVLLMVPLNGTPCVEPALDSGIHKEASEPRETAAVATLYTDSVVQDEITAFRGVHTCDETFMTQPTPICIPTTPGEVQSRAVPLDFGIQTPILKPPTKTLGLKRVLLPKQPASSALVLSQATSSSIPTNSNQILPFSGKINESQCSSGAVTSPQKLLVKTKEGGVSVFKIPADGNCLFLSMSHQLFGYAIMSPKHIEGAMKLRSTISHFLLEHLPVFYETLRAEVEYWGARYSTTDDQVPEIIQNRFDVQQRQQNGFLSSLQKVVRYLHDLKISGQIWGCHECVMAVADIFQVAVEIHVEGATKIRVVPREAAAINTLHISHRRFSATTLYPDHYDSVAHDGIPAVRGVHTYDETFMTQPTSICIPTTPGEVQSSVQIPSFSGDFDNSNSGAFISSPDKEQCPLKEPHMVTSTPSNVVSFIPCSADVSCTPLQLKAIEQTISSVLPADISVPSITPLVEGNTMLQSSTEISRGSSLSLIPSTESSEHQILSSGGIDDSSLGVSHIQQGKLLPMVTSTPINVRDRDAMEALLLLQNTPCCKISSFCADIDDSSLGVSPPHKEQGALLPIVTSAPINVRNKEAMEALLLENMPENGTPSCKTLGIKRCTLGLQPNLNKSKKSINRTRTLGVRATVLRPLCPKPPNVQNFLNIPPLQTQRRKDFSTSMEGLPLQWVSKQFPDKTVAALLDENLKPIRRVTLENTTSLTVEVHGQELNKSHSFFQEVYGFSLGRICRAVNDTSICPGLNSEKYRYLWSKYPDAVVDTHEAPATLRAPSCLLLGNFMGPCPRCCQLRGNLQSSHSRAEKRQQNQPLHPEKKPVKYMTSEEKTQRILLLSVKVKQLTRAKLAIEIRFIHLKTNGIDLKDLDGTFRKIMEAHADKLTPIQALFWQEQLKALGCKGPSGMRWNPMMIRLAIHLEAKSSGSYESFRKTGIFRLPCKTTLRDYTDLHPEKEGIRHHNLATLKEKTKDLPKERNVFLIMDDEMTVSEDVVFCSRTGRLLGFVNLSSIEEEIERLDTDQSSYRPKTAKKILVYMAKCLAGPRELKQTVGIFSVTSATSVQIYDRTWGVIEVMEMLDMPTLIIVCDGARTNRTFFQFHKRVDAGEDEVIYKTANIFSPEGNRPLFFISDVAHLLKCLRNIFAEDHLWKNGEHITWQWILDLYYKDAHKTLRKSCKLTENHVKLNNWNKMKVAPAAQVCSETSALNLEDLHGDKVKETIKFIRLVDRFFDCLNGHNTIEGRHHLKPDRDPYTRPDDPRFEFLKHFVDYLKQWREEVMKRPGRFTKMERKAMTVTQETYQGIYITVNSFIEVVQYLLTEVGVSFINSRDLTCQDDLEQYFEEQRERGKLNNNPSLKQALHNDTKILKKGEISARLYKGNTKRKKTEIVIDETPMPRRPKVLRN